MAAAKHIELPAVVVPPHLWTRSGRPVQGRIVQVVVPGALVVAGLLASGTATRVGLVLAGLGLFLLLPAMVLGRLERLGREAQAADPKAAAALLRTLRHKPVVKFFAPHAWLTLQEAILQLKTGEGKAAAVNFVETARLVRQPDAVMLLSAQAHALVVAGERAEAREILQRLAKENLIGPRDQLDLGIVLLVESKKNKQALAYIEAARKTIGDHPRVLAAMALALQKTERIDEASELLEQVQIALQGGEADPVVEDLVKRARKGLQAFIEAQLRRERRSRSRRTTIVVSSDLAASEIVSGEIGAGDQAQLDNPTTSFRPAGEASVISSKSVDGELTKEERTMLNIPQQRSRRDPGKESSSSSFSIEEDSAAHEEASDTSDTSEGVPLSSSLFDSVLTALSEPVPATSASISLINPAVTVPVVSESSKLLDVLAPIVPEPQPSPPPTAPPPTKPGEVDVPVFRRKQTLLNVPAVPDKALGNLPTGGNSGLTNGPQLASLPIAGPKAALPTRPRAEKPAFTPPTNAAPRGTPMFRAPTIGKLDDKDADEGDEPGRR